MSPQPASTLKGFGVTLKQVFKKPITQQYPEYKRPVYPRYRGRHRLHRHENGLEKCVGCSLCAAACASGKLFLAQLTPAQRHRLLASAPLEAYTPKTITDLGEFEEEIKRVKRQGFALDNEEFLPGLLCVAVLVPAPSGRSNLCVAVQAPIMRMTAEKALQTLPPLQRAAEALSRIEAGAEAAASA